MRLFLFFFLFCNALLAQSSFNVELFGTYQRGDTRYSGSWAYIAPDDSEYALLGARTGMAVYSIDNAENIQELGFIPGPETKWREITVIDQHAYVVTDVQGEGHSMQVVYLGDLPDSISLVTSYDATFQKGHIIQRDIYSDAPYVYVHGTDSQEGTHIIDVSNPANPVEVGVYAPGYYIHDGHVKGDYLYAAAFYEDKIDVVDISDKTNPTLITSIPDPGNNTHSSWLTEDNKYLFVADEQDGVPATIFDIQDLDDPAPVARVLANEESLLHNPYIKGDFAFCSHNTEGLIIYDVEDPTLPVQVGNYDTYFGESGGFSGLWSACPYFPSGKIIGGDRTEGLMIWTFNDTKAARFYGVVRDSVTGDLLPNAVVTLAGNENLFLDNNAAFKYGNLAGEFSLTVSMAAYYTKDTTIYVNEGEMLDIVIDLVPEGVATDDVEIETTLNIFPNPCSRMLSIEMPKEKTFQKIEIKNTLGQTILEQSCTTYQDYQTINVSILETGIYWVCLFEKDSGIQYTQKMLKK